MESSCSKKRDRNANFSSKETETLLSLIEAKKHVIHSKKCNAIAWQDKEKAWKSIEKDFNSVGGEVHRDAKHLKVKYESMKRDVRKKLIHLADSDGKNPSFRLTPIDLRVQEMMLMKINHTQENSDSDSDQFINQNSRDFMVEIEKVDVEEPPPPKVRCVDTDVLTPGIALGDTITPKVWTDWKPSIISTEEHSSLDGNVQQKDRKEIINIDETIDEKNKLFNFQKKLIGEEIQEKLLRKILVREEIEHKREIHKLQKEEMLLKIELLKAEIQNVRKNEVPDEV